MLCSPRVVPCTTRCQALPTWQIGRTWDVGVTLQQSASFDNNLGGVHETCNLLVSLVLFVLPPLGK